jgi:hypothetical protein
MYNTEIHIATADKFVYLTSLASSVGMSWHMGFFMSLSDPTGGGW